MGQGYTSFGAAAYRASINPTCQIAPPPPPPPPVPGITQAQLDSAIADAQTQNTNQVERAGAMLLNIISSTASTVFKAAVEAAAALITRVEKRISDIETKLLASADALEQKVTNIFTVEIPKLWTIAEEIVQHAEEEATAWRAGVAGIWDTLEAWLVERLVGLMLRALDRDVEAKP